MGGGQLLGVPVRNYTSLRVYGPLWVRWSFGRSTATPPTFKGSIDVCGRTKEEINKTATGVVEREKRKPRERVLVVAGVRWDLP